MQKIILGKMKMYKYYDQEGWRVTQDGDNQRAFIYDENDKLVSVYESSHILQNAEAQDLIDDLKEARDIREQRLY